MIGNAVREQGDFRQALAFHRRAVTVLEKTAVDHPDYAEVLSDLGEDLRRLGRAAESLSYHERAVKLLQGQSPTNARSVMLYQGLALLDLGRRQATASLARARVRARLSS